MIHRKNYSQLGEPVGPYVHATKFNGLLFTSGLTAAGTPAESGDITEQTREIFRQLETILKAEGSDLSHLLKVTLFARDLAELAKMRETLYSIYGDNIPASAAVGVADLFLPQVKIEIEAIAAVP